MSNGLGTTTWVEFRVERGASGMAVMGCTLAAPGLRHESRFASHPACEAVLTPGLAAYLSETLGAVADNLPQDRAVVWPSFFRAFGALTLENQRLSRQDDDTFTMRYQITSGGASAVFKSPETLKIPDSLSDVFLPLTNLSSYLRAMSDTLGAMPSASALDLTADRIEEFLLAYGSRLCSETGPSGVAHLSA